MQESEPLATISEKIHAGRVAAGGELAQCSTLTFRSQSELWC